MTTDSETNQVNDRAASNMVDSADHELAIIQDLLDGNYDVLKDESILNLCKKDGSCILTEKFVVCCTDITNPFINDLIQAANEYQNNLDAPKQDVVVRIASRQAIKEVLSKSNNDLLKDISNSAIDLSDEANKQAIGELEQLLYEVREKKVADVHIKATSESTIVYVRTSGGVTRHYDSAREAEYGLRLGGLIFGTYASEGSNGSFLPTEANDTTFSWLIEGKSCRFRASTVPIRNGCKIVIRSLEPFSNEVPTLTDLGFLPAQIKMLMHTINQPSGSLLITGQTGSGKTTTLASLVDAIPENKSVHTLEDPIELILENASQTEINVSGDEDNLGVKIGSFAYFGRRLLRQDIDVGVFGELRDKQSVQVFYHLATTGHLLLGTMHVSSATGVPNMLMNTYGLNPLQAADKDAFTCFMHQKLPDKVCQACCHSHDEHKSILKTELKDALVSGVEARIFSAETRLNRLNYAESIFKGQLEGLRYSNDKGCNQCEFTGKSGKTVLAEILMLDDNVRQFIEDQKTTEMVAYLKSQGFPTVRDHALHCIKLGIIDIHAAARVVGELDNSNATSFNYGELIDEISINTAEVGA
ncbi:GspE/PulE family protein [Vibrio gangliei]|uniref:GspE/PulE family protein n=1 Tax=Vibrio gangliei TaxID=2077090 RepID=UPI000D01DEB3|nr:ATPase, T2SS/T4P/T4SS family [Vibrio gangliei]